MSTKHLLALPLLLPLLAMSATAQAGSTITDKSYWPNEAKRTAPVSAGSQTDVYAYDRAMSPSQPAAPVSRRPAFQYQGGPKGR
jgi:hypothetical protein